MPAVESLDERSSCFHCTCNRVGENWKIYDTLCECARARACVRARVFVCAYVCACVHVCVLCVYAWGGLAYARTCLCFVPACVEECRMSMLAMFKTSTHEKDRTCPKIVKNGTQTQTIDGELFLLILFVVE